MLNNLLGLLVYKARGLIKNPDAPVAFVYKTASNEIWQVMVTRIPDEVVAKMKAAA